VNVTIPLATSHTLAHTLELIYPLVAIPGINHCRAVPTYSKSGTTFVLIGVLCKHESAVDFDSCLK